MPHHVFGIRHHGPGSARSLVTALQDLQPDVVLIEGPPDADAVLTHAARNDLTLPIALLVYEDGTPQNAVFYPFALFSPEWQAIQYALKRSIPVRFMDLPQSMRLARKTALQDEGTLDDGDNATEDQPQEPEYAFKFDPLLALAQAAGYNDSERWWDHVVESHQDGTPVFIAVAQAMAALREHYPDQDPLEAQREAYMRQTIRAAGKEGFEKVAVVCGAWHAPALEKLGPASQDQAILKGLSKVKTSTAWVPWSYDRLSYRSGYGAGVSSPQWYHLLWEQPVNPATHWMTRAARLLREKDLDASSASVIEGVRLAQQLAALRERAIPGLDELLEASLSVLCNGEPQRLELIAHQLVVGQRLGVIPADMPATPLMQDLQALIKRLRLVQSADFKDYELDLRKDNDLERSRLLHRLGLLNIQWGQKPHDAVRSRGTFREVWRLTWQPEFAVELVEGSRYGSTVFEAASNRLIEQATSTSSIADLSEQLQSALLAELPTALELILKRLADCAAVARDVSQLLSALDPLAQTRRYGSVRQTDGQVLDHILEALVARIVIGLPIACRSLDDDAAKQMQHILLKAEQAIVLLDQDAWRTQWHQALNTLADQEDLHGLIAGAVTRLLHDAGLSTPETTAQRMSLALSRASAPNLAAHWIEGFLSGGAQALLLDETLLKLLDEWVCSLNPTHFTESLPLLRRAFTTFEAAERRQLGEQIRRGGSVRVSTTIEGLDMKRAAQVLPVLRTIFAQEGARS